jgi:hypothetical protein
MASKGQMNGMLGVYLAAAELTRRGIVVSPTSRSAKGVDLLAADQSNTHAWSVQVKTNGKSATWWLLNKDYKSDCSKSHVYIFVNLNGDKRPDYYVVPSKVVARDGQTFRRRSGAIFYGYDRRKAEKYRENWSLFEIRK